MKKTLNFGIIGPGSHFKKNIAPVLKKIDKIKVIKYFGSSKKKDEEKKKKLFFSNNLDFVYISSPNKIHAKNILDSLNNGCHVICEKPFITNKKDLKKIIITAKKTSKLIFEVFSYIYHPAFIFIKKYLEDKRKELLIVNSSFTIPFLNKNNNRYKKYLGDGFFFDSAVYPLSLEEFLFTSKKEANLISKLNFKKNVPLKGNIFLSSNNIYKNYKWGEGQKYSNYIEIIGKNFSLFCDHIYSKKFNEEIIVEIIRNKKIKKLKFQTWSQFDLMFKDILKNFKKRDYKKKKILEIKNNLKIREKFN